MKAKVAASKIFALKDRVPAISLNQSSSVQVSERSFSSSLVSMMLYQWILSIVRQRFQLGMCHI